MLNALLLGENVITSAESRLAANSKLLLVRVLDSKNKVVKHVKPDASRKESVESYVLAMHYKNKT